eukprot:14645-Heterococcus_DN1.PRE.5
MIDVVLNSKSEARHGTTALWLNVIATLSHKAALYIAPQLPSHARTAGLMDAATSVESCSHTERGRTGASRMTLHCMLYSRHSHMCVHVLIYNDVLNCRRCNGAQL